MHPSYPVMVNGADATLELRRHGLRIVYREATVPVLLLPFRRLRSWCDVNSSLHVSDAHSGELVLDMADGDAALVARSMMSLALQLRDDEVADAELEAANEGIRGWISEAAQQSAAAAPPVAPPPVDVERTAPRWEQEPPEELPDPEEPSSPPSEPCDIDKAPPTDLDISFHVAAAPRVPVEPAVVDYIECATSTGTLYVTI